MNLKLFFIYKDNPDFENWTWCQIIISVSFIWIGISKEIATFHTEQWLISKQSNETVFLLVVIKIICSEYRKFLNCTITNLTKEIEQSIEASRKTNQHLSFMTHAKIFFLNEVYQNLIASSNYGLRFLKQTKSTITLSSLCRT